MPIIVNYGDKTVTLKVTVTAPNTTVPSTPTPTPQPSTEKQTEKSTEKQTEKTTEVEETGESVSKVTTERTTPKTEDEMTAIAVDFFYSVTNACGFNDSSLTDLQKLTNLTKYMATNFPYTHCHAVWWFCSKDYLEEYKHVTYITEGKKEANVWGCDCVGYSTMIVEAALELLGYSAEDAYMDLMGVDGHMVAYVKIDGIRYMFDAGSGSEGQINRDGAVFKIGEGRIF